MKISQDLLQKYALGQCTQNERTLVEDWLASATEEETNQFVDLFESSRHKILKRIHQDVVPIEKIRPYGAIIKTAIAACFALIFFSAGVFYAHQGRKASAVETVDTGKTKEHALYISTISGTSQKISAEEYNINFDGLIRLYNVADTEQTIVCNDKAIILQPNKPYFIMSSSSNGFFKLKDQVALEDFSRTSSMSNFFEVCVKS